MINTTKMNWFHLEELIQNTWQTKTDLEDLLWKIYEDETAPTEDEFHNTILGVIEMHDIRCRRLFECFEKLLEKGDIK